MQTMTLPGDVSSGLSSETVAIIGGAAGGGCCVLVSLIVALAVLRSRRKAKPQAEALPTFSPPIGLAEFKSARADDSFRIEPLRDNAPQVSSDNAPQGGSDNGNYASIDVKGGGLQLPPPPPTSGYGTAGLPPPPLYGSTGGLSASPYSTGRDELGAMVQVGRGYSAVPSEVSGSSAPPAFQPMPYAALPSMAGTLELPTMQL